jgi:hypothetical protein
VSEGNSQLLEAAVLFRRVAAPQDTMGTPTTLYSLIAHTLPNLSPDEVEEKEQFERYVLESTLGRGQRAGAGTSRGGATDEEWRSVVEEMRSIGEFGASWCSCWQGRGLEDGLLFGVWRGSSSLVAGTAAGEQRTDTISCTV